MNFASKNKSKSYGKLPQFRSVQTVLSGGFLLMLSSGIHIGHGFFHWESVNVPWTSGASSKIISFAAITWFMGSIAGFILTPMLLKMINKQSAYLISNFMVAISAVILISGPEYFYAVFFARLVAGVAHGLGYVTVVKHFGEICEDSVRGRLGTFLHLSILKGGIISGSALMRFFSTDGRMDPNRFLGICSLILSLIALVITLIFYKESILTLVEAGRDDEAVETLMILRSQREETAEITETVNEYKAMIAEDKEILSGIFQGGNARPLFVVTLLRVAYVMTFNYGIKHVHIFMTSTSQSGIDYTFVLNLVHTLTTFAVIFTIDTGRRKHFIVSACGTSLILIAFGAFRSTSYADTDLVVFAMFVTFQLFAAIALGPTAHIYSAEAFPAAKKTSSIAFTSVVEHFFQIVFIIVVEKRGSSEHFDVALLVVSGLVLSVISGYLFVNLPETKNMSLRQAKNKFLKI